VFYTQGATRNIFSASNSRMYIENVGLQPLSIPGEHSKGEANQLHDVFNMPQSKSLMATIQDI
jgi:hypothetical protein